ncbi:MAG: 50S ribosomal protein L29 [Rickettsiaceae bacterium]|nr:MAG: 50S ribosomal protein L29 [Rickettsiaceae bacterium]
MIRKNKLSQEIKSYTLEDIQKNFVQLKKELFNLRFQKASGELKNTSLFLMIRKKIARFKTELNLRKNREF